MRRLSPRWGLAFLVALWIVLGLVYSVVVPLFEAPDEIWHFSFIQVLARQRTLPVQPAEGKDMWLREAGQPPLYHLLGALLVAPLDTADFPGFVRFNVAHPAVTRGSLSTVSNVFVHTEHEAFPYRGSVLAVHLVRLFTLLWGAGTIVGTYLVAREVVPRSPGLALGAAVIAAFNPHFIFISSVINNDAAAACLCTLALWAAIRLAKGTESERVRPPAARLVSPALLGLWLGLSLLSKLSALALLPLVALALGLAWWRERGQSRPERGQVGRVWLVQGIVVYGVALGVAGWWYARNWRLYGDPLGWSVWLIDIGVQRISLDELVRQFGRVATSYWSPYDGLLPQRVFWALGLLLAAAAAGWVRWIAQPKVRAVAESDGLLLAGVWFVLLFASLIRYMTTTPSAEGRLLYPGIASASLLLVLGWAAIVPRRWENIVWGVIGAGLLALCVAVPFFAIVPRFAPPLVTEARELDAVTPVEGGDWSAVRLLGVRVEPKVAQPGEALDVSLYWQAVKTSPDGLQTDLQAGFQAVVRLWTPRGRLLGQWDGMAGESYPPDMWQAGDVVRDTYRLRVSEDGPAIYRLGVDVRLKGEMQGEEALSPFLFRVAPVPLDHAPARPASYTLGDQVKLIGYAMPEEFSLSNGLPVTLYWRALAEMDEDYTVFLHLLDAQGARIGQGDGPPFDGDYPTSSWSPGEELADTHLVLPVEGLSWPDVPAGAYLLVGLYRPGDGARMPVVTETGERILHDAIRLDRLP